MGLMVLATSIWMAVDASQLGYDKRDVPGLAGMGPVGWFLSGLLLWIVAFPFYLMKRGELKAAGERRRALLDQAMNALPPQVAAWGYGTDVVPPGAGPPKPLDVDELTRELTKLDEMRASGLLTHDEFEEQKARLLARS